MQGPGIFCRAAPATKLSNVTIRHFVFYQYLQKNKIRRSNCDFSPPWNCVLRQFFSLGTSTELVETSCWRWFCIRLQTTPDGLCRLLHHLFYVPVAYRSDDLYRKNRASTDELTRKQEARFGPGFEIEKKRQA